MHTTKSDIKAWCRILEQYQRKPFTQYGAAHLLGYLRRCQHIGELQYDQYISQWLECIRLIIRYDPNSEYNLSLVSLYHELQSLNNEP